MLVSGDNLTGQSIHHYYFRTPNAYKYNDTYTTTVTAIVLAPTHTLIKGTKLIHF